MNGQEQEYSFQKHYENLLSQYYTKIFGGRNINENSAMRILKEFGLDPEPNFTVIDLGAGPGFYTIPLEKLGYKVTAVDMDTGLLDELKMSSVSSETKIIRDDIMNLDCFSEKESTDLVICMTDVISHLNSYEYVRILFKKIYECLNDNGKFLISFRDQSVNLQGVARFKAFYSDNDLIVTTFLEQDKETVQVTDLFQIKEDDSWLLIPGTYRKIRMFATMIYDLLYNSGFKIIGDKMKFGLTYFLCVKVP